MDFSEEYDCVILGEHPAGLWTAFHLSDLDKKVLVLPLGIASGVHALPRQVALDFGWTLDDWDRGEDFLQILTPERRFRVGGSVDELVREYEFQFGGTPGSDSGFSGEVARGLAYLARGSETGPVLSSEWRRWADLCLQTVHFEKDPGYIARRMLRQLSGRGVHIAPVGALQRIFIDRGNLAGVQLAGSSRMIAVKTGFLCAHLELLKDLMSEPVPLRSEPQGWKFHMRFSCGFGALPRGMGSRMVYVQKDAPVLEIRQPHPGEFCLTTELPLSEEAFDRGNQRRLCERMMRVCEGIIPDLEYNLQLMNPELRDPERAERSDLPHLHPFQAPDQIPVDRLVYSASRGLGYQTPCANLHLVHSESDPRQGMWGAFQAAVSAMSALTKGDSRLQGRSEPLLLS